MTFNHTGMPRTTGTAAEILMGGVPEADPGIARVSRSRQQARALYDGLADRYDLIAGFWEKAPREIGLRKLSACEGESILEIGFGTGHGILALAKSVGHSGTVHGVDLSPRMVRITESRVERAGLSDRVRLHCGDAAELHFATDSLDGIFASFTLELFDTPEIPHALAEWHRVLRPGGHICIVSLSKAGGRSWMRELYEWGHRIFPAIVDCRPIFVQRALEAARFRILDITQMSMWGLPIEIVLASWP
jgi:demethylmenaquinone methyltransferase/2-methoxy-6-polyprenyl-1,4-benzoquinol methylase